MPLRLLFADAEGRVYDHPELLAAVGDPLDGEPPLQAAAPAARGVALPPYANLQVLPGRVPLGLDPGTGQVSAAGPLRLGQRTLRPLAVAAVLPPGWTRLHLPAYRTRAVAPVLPQWAYTAAAWDDDSGAPVAFALRTDRRTHWDPARHSTPDLPERVAALRAALPDNPVLEQLQTCALRYRCFTAQNTFLARDEGAIPASSGCNARCVGCISEQGEDGPEASHARIRRAPDAAEMAAVGAVHLSQATGRVLVSFGQGCEGEPLTRSREVARAIRLIRERTGRGSISVNTNGSLPKALGALADAGLDACRISLNSAHAPLYEAYYRPVGYRWADVRRSIEVAVGRGLYTALNLLTFPGVTDRAGEVEALCALVAGTGVHQIQMRSLAMDPEAYVAVARPAWARGPALGIPALLRALRRARPGLSIGNFARAKEERRGADLSKS